MPSSEPRQISDLSPNELRFLHAYTRRCLVDWCAQGIANGDGTFSVTFTASVDMPRIGPMRDLLLAYARLKGWVGKREPPRMTSTGYKSATGMLKLT